MKMGKIIFNRNIRNIFWHKWIF